MRDISPPGDRSPLVYPLMDSNHYPPNLKSDHINYAKEATKVLSVL